MTPATERFYLAIERTHNEIEEMARKRREEERENPAEAERRRILTAKFLGVSYNGVCEQEARCASADSYDSSHPREQQLKIYNPESDLLA